MELLRTPDERFENLPDYPFAPHYFEDGGARIHFVDEGPADADFTILCLHGEPTWSYLYRHIILALRDRYRMIAPDLMGFGKSDKPVGWEAHTYDAHIHYLQDLIDHLDLKNVVLLCQDWGGLFGLPLAARNPDRFTGLFIMNTGLPDPGDVSLDNVFRAASSIGFLAWRTFALNHPDLPVGRLVSMGCWPPNRLEPAIVAAYNAPFPDKKYKAGVDMLPRLVPVLPGMEAAAVMREAREKLQEWQRPVQVAFSDRDPITWAQAGWFRKYVPGAAKVPEITFRNAGHFLQEDKPEEIAVAVDMYIRTHLT